jgi:hypothetical protein
MLSGRRKRDYEADALASQGESSESSESGAISPSEAAEAGMVTAPDETSDDPADERAAGEDEQVLVLA